MEEAGDSSIASESEEEPDSEQCGTANPHSLNQKTSSGMWKLFICIFNKLTQL